MKCITDVKKDFEAEMLENLSKLISEAFMAGFTLKEIEYPKRAKVIDGDIHYNFNIDLPEYYETDFGTVKLI